MANIWGIVGSGYTTLVLCSALGFGVVWAALDWLRGWPIMSKLSGIFLTIGLLIINLFDGYWATNMGVVSIEVATLGCLLVSLTVSILTIAVQLTYRH